MSKFKIASKVLKHLAIGATAGAFVGATQTIPGQRGAGAKEGALHGAYAIGGLMALPKLGRAAAKTVLIGRAGLRHTKVVRTGRIMFRRIRGRLVPIKV